MTGARVRRAVLVLAAVTALATVSAPVDAETLGPPEPFWADWTPAVTRRPAGDAAQSAGYVVSSLRIPSIGVEETVRAGIDLSIINQGPAHWSGTSPVGGSGNVVLAGHRTTFGAPFYDLDRLVPGDLVFLTDPRGFEVIYRVSQTFVVDPSAIWITYDSGDPTLTLFACHPKGSAAQRIVVRADLVADGRIA